VRQRLANIARKSSEDVQRVLVRYAIERLLYRMSVSRYKDRFVLKGAMLFSLWTDAPYRSTGDLDLLGRGDNAPDALRAVFTEIASIEPDPPDALLFESQGMRAELLRADTAYAGVRLRLDAKLGRAKLPVMVDIGYGDVITPGPEQAVFPSLLDMPRAKLKSYPPETVIAEKLEAMAALGLLNSRVKDLYDLWAISQAFNLDGARVVEAVRATFGRRRTELGAGLPAMLTDPFAKDASRQQLWRAFLDGRAEIENAPKVLDDIAAQVAVFVGPVLFAAAKDTPLGAWSAKARAWA
jgi:hypothetical protein